MPLYDFRCQHCDGIFECRVAISDIATAQLRCVYCQQLILAKPLITGHQILKKRSKWKAGSAAEQLAGPLVTGPGTDQRSGRNSVLHNCKGVNCSVCGL